MFPRNVSKKSQEPDFKQIEQVVMLFNQGRFTDAETLARKITVGFPDFGFGWKCLGAILKSMERTRDSLKSMQRAAELMPNDAEAQSNLGVTLKDLGHLKEAEACYLRALKIRPDFAEALNNLGVVLEDMGRLREAEARYRRALQIKPDVADILSNLGHVLNDLGQVIEAEACQRRALAIKPDFAKAHNSLGIIQNDLCLLEEAEASFHLALKIKPDVASYHYNLGHNLSKQRRFEEAEACYRHAISIKQDCVQATFNLAILLLAVGRYTEAWPLYEARYKLIEKERSTWIPDIPYPQWRGETLTGKSLVIWPEQGYGDYIQFIRYASLLKERGLSCLSLVCPAPLEELFKTAAGIDAVITDIALLPRHDYWSFPLSLPLYLGSSLETIPTLLPYLHPLPDRVERWRKRLPAEGFKVGLVWKGSADHRNDAARSLPDLGTLSSLWSLSDVTFITLQKGQGEEEVLLFQADQPVIDLGKDIADFADTAAIVSQLDLVICVDTAVAHLTGALGKPCWILLPYFGTDWRWLLDRRDSPWYPGCVRLFRQSSGGDWAGVVTQVFEALKLHSRECRI